MKEKTYPIVYRKAVKCVVGGLMLSKRGDGYVEEEFLLKGDPSKVDPDDITIEIPDVVAEKFFVKNNKPAIQNGYLMEISDYEMSLDSGNAVSDGVLKDILKKPFAQMKKRVQEFTSPIPVNRLLNMAEEDNKPVKTIDFLRSELVRLNK